jgi:hypothetical protein
MWKRATRLTSIAPDKSSPEAMATESRPRVVSGQCAPLHRYLEHRYADVVVLTFKQIEDLLGFALPQRARIDRTWWTLRLTPADGRPFSDAWTLAGRTATPNLLAKNVVFERRR